MTSAARLRSASDSGGRVEQQERLAEEDRAGVLHRAGLEVGHGDEVELAVGVRDAEVRFEPPQRLRAPPRAPKPARWPLPGTCQTRIGVSPTMRTADASSGPTASASRYVESGGVFAKRTSRRPSRRGSSRSIGLFETTTSLLRAVDREPIARLEAWLVEAGKHPARVGGLELGEGIPSTVGCGRVETAQVCAQLPGKREHECCAPRDAASRDERHGFIRAPWLEPDGMHGPFRLDGRALDGQIGGMQRDGGSRPGDLDVDPHLATKRPGSEIGLEEQLIVGGTNRGVETEARGPASFRHQEDSKARATGYRLQARTSRRLSRSPKPLQSMDPLVLARPFLLVQGELLHPAHRGLRPLPGWTFIAVMVR